MAKKEISRSISEEQADRIYSNIIFTETITDTSFIDLGRVSFKQMGTFSLSIIASLVSPASAPTMITLTFTKFIDNVQVKGTPYSIDILASDIVANPTRTIVNVNDLLPDAVFTDLNIKAQSSDNTDVNLEIRVTGD